LIPTTYNRSKFLEKNLEILNPHIHNIIKEFIKANPRLNTNYFLQERNKELEKKSFGRTKTCESRICYVSG